MRKLKFSEHWYKLPAIFLVLLTLFIFIKKNQKPNELGVQTPNETTVKEKNEDKEKIKKIADDIVQNAIFVKNEQTGLCFAVFNNESYDIVGVTEVHCSGKVMDSISLEKIKKEGTWKY